MTSDRCHGPLWIGNFALSGLLWLALLTVFACARTLYPGQYAQYSPEERAWFKGVHTSQGVPCCDVADGHRTTWRHGEFGYEVPVTDDAQVIHWLPVPAAAVIENAHNPTHDSIVWYRDYGPGFPNDAERYYIRCFVPGDGA